ncbi:ShlB/FhaC/HecB family hemolysin secretion/activation protein [Pseudomonas sp. JV241A]|uniref:ShlB/FhaC/HecB family hemolysin secretion/activation protein n=1 Tax=Pseudomonas sp. JV241A TaxID=2078785 RepID=UPI00100C9185|nr:ShlB/FhaC/HecB family hemolysin secretion/activation protein [Pseudomonas sp. JV241A]SPO68378.1 TPS family activation/secretion protein [Pseudomonas sp. JV241A]
MPCSLSIVAARLGIRHPAAPGIFVVLLLMVGPASAHEHLGVQPLRDQRLYLEQLEQRQRLRKLQRTDELPEPATDVPTPAEATPCWPLNGVRLAGNRELTSAELAANVQPLVTPCMDVAQINLILKSITQQYVQAGYPTSRPYLVNPPQAGTTLDIEIVEGFVESIELATPDLPLSLSSAFPTLLGEPLRLTELEQGMDQLNRLRAFELGADLMPGELEGGTRIVITSRQVNPRWRLGSTYDNRGSELTGRDRVGASLTLDSPLQLNDYTQLSVTSTLGSGPRYSRGYGLYYSIPYGPWTYALNLNQLHYQAQLPGRRVRSSGQSDFYGLSLERNLWRNQYGLLSASLRLDQKRQDNRLAGQRLQLQSPTLTSLEAGLNLLWLDANLWSANLGIVQGLDRFGADSAPLASNAPQPQFRKYRANLLHLRQGRDPAWPWRWQSELNLQYSPDALPAVEQFLLSDNSAVRGFRQQVAAGATGAVWRNTLSQPLALDLPAGLVIRPQLGMDLGWSKFDHGRTAQQLAGAHAGLELSLPDSLLKLDYQRALHASNTRRQDLKTGYWLLEWVMNI